jgi:hypothetical protein
MSADDAARQGHFDALCGVYAIINAIDHVLGSMSMELQRDLFSKMIKSRKNDLATIMTQGTDNKDLTEFLDVAQSWCVRKKVGFFKHVMLYKKCPLVAPRTMAREFGDVLKDSEGAFIISHHLPPHHGHWTTLIKADDENFHVMDSGYFDPVIPLKTIVGENPEIGQCCIDLPSSVLICKHHK